jgi:hypothetical protein
VTEEITTQPFATLSWSGQLVGWGDAVVAGDARPVNPLAGHAAGGGGGAGALERTFITPSSFPHRSGHPPHRPGGAMLVRTEGAMRASRCDRPPMGILSGAARGFLRRFRFGAVA